MDRHALPAPEQTLRPTNRSATEPRHPMEETVAKIWSAVLGRARIGIHDNFFELGGHSLLAAQAVARLNESFNIHLSIRSLFEKPTIAGLAREVERVMNRRNARRAPAIVPVARAAYRATRPSPPADAEVVKPH